LSLNKKWQLERAMKEMPNAMKQTEHAMQEMPNAMRKSRY
jgi:hypothetical protein